MKLEIYHRHDRAKVVTYHFVTYSTGEVVLARLSPLPLTLCPINVLLVVVQVRQNFCANA